MRRNRVTAVVIVAKMTVVMKERLDVSSSNLRLKKMTAPTSLSAEPRGTYHRGGTFKRILADLSDIIKTNT